eukprot:TRINITY_DN8520_c0_g1_i2.p1 TRINITY_DN8520_c0_g1~~TRINITY_DN8520_c0_g1_i2.p1  ORF type:complete len:160 (-),score=18.79 TRINITY_DN8520_c0_g1_i2:833-1258(-)
MSTSVSPISSKSDGKEILFTWKFKDFIEVLSNYVRSPEFAALFDVRGILALRRTSKAISKIFNKEYIRMVIRLGNLEEPLRLCFWAHNAPWLEYLLCARRIERDLRVKLSIASVFDTVYDKLLEGIGEKNVEMEEYDLADY